MQIIQANYQQSIVAADSLPWTPANESKVQCAYMYIISAKQTEYYNHITL